MTQTAEYVAIKVIIDGAQAQTQLDNLGASSAKSAVAGGALTSTFNALDNATGQASKAVGGLHFALGSLTGPARGALKDVGDLAMILGGGGILGIALTGATIAFGKLYQQVQEADQRMQDLHRTLREKVAKSLEEVRRGAEDAERRLLEIGSTPQRMAVTQAETAFGSAIAQEKNAQIAIGAWQERRRELLMKRREMDRAEFMSASEQMRADHAVLMSLLEKARASIPFLERQMIAERELLKAENAATAATLKRSLDKIENKPAKSTKSGIDTNEFLRRRFGVTPAEAAELAKEQEEAIQKAQEALRDQDLEFAKNHAEALLAIKADRLKREDELEQQAIAKQFADAHAAAQVVQQIASIGTSAISQLVDGLITGQEHALEQFAISIMRQAGTALIGKGIELGGAATVSALTGNLPGAAVQAAGSAALITSGVALGGVATGIEHTMINGGQIGSAAPGTGSRDRGVNDGARGGYGSSGTVVYVSNYGVYGPSPEDSAREQTRMTRTARRRGIS